MQHYFFLEAVVRRLCDDDVQFPQFSDELYRLQAGLSGELKLQQCLADYPFMHEHTIMYNYECINERGFTHQIDALLLTSNFILVLEVKHLAGLLTYDSSTHQFSREKADRSVENLFNPFDQVYRHRLFVEQLLRQHAISLPVHHLVIISNYRARLDSSLHAMPVIHLSGLPYYLDQLFSKSPPAKVAVSALRKLFEARQQPLSHKRTIERNRIKTGVFCSKCPSYSVMTFHYGIWTCSRCGWKSGNAVVQALHDYRYLVHPAITNKDFRWFTQIDSVFSASRLLSQLPLQAIGDRKDRKYVIPDDILKKNFEVANKMRKVANKS